MRLIALGWPGLGLPGGWGGIRRSGGPPIRRAAAPFGRPRRLQRRSSFLVAAVLPARHGWRPRANRPPTGEPRPVRAFDRSIQSGGILLNRPDPYGIFAEVGRPKRPAPATGPTATRDVNSPPISSSSDPLRRVFEGPANRRSPPLRPSLCAWLCRLRHLSQIAIVPHYDGPMTIPLGEMSPRSLTAIGQDEAFDTREVLRR